ncbi:hypothetical protein DFP72DRAFT_1168607 [Ephemerocybe angulata]|uniref:Uncharacterized protein n=1 Tax=Ephemerocybe angulata TaxID=980116 RepID=A0A8H6M9B6_9AGAR|nr:hypothetical protein DFP72DRAFT_1168607 [Tulosesus angulatus]
MSLSTTGISRTQHLRPSTTTPRRAFEAQFPYSRAGRKLTYMESSILSFGVWAPASLTTDSAFRARYRPHHDLPVGQNKPSTFTARSAFLERNSHTLELGAN